MRPCPCPHPIADICSALGCFWHWEVVSSCDCYTYSSSLSLGTARWPALAGEIWKERCLFPCRAFSCQCNISQLSPFFCLWVTGTWDKASSSLGLQMMRMSTLQLLTHIGQMAEGKVQLSLFSVPEFLGCLFLQRDSPYPGLWSLAHSLGFQSSPVGSRDEHTGHWHHGYSLPSLFISCAQHPRLCGPHCLHPQLSCLWNNEQRQFSTFSFLFSSKIPSHLTSGLFLCQPPLLASFPACECRAICNLTSSSASSLTSHTPLFCPVAG